MSLWARGGLSIAHCYQAVNKECVNGGRSGGAPSSPKCKLHHMAAVCQYFFPEEGETLCAVYSLHWIFC